MSDDPNLPPDTPPRPVPPIDPLPDPEPDPRAGRAAFDRRMLEALVCPQTQAPLSYDAERQELVSRAANLAYPIRGGIPVMLADEARPLD
ncbi:hypothetical protein CLV79_101433 [Limimaricola soesokkakensis]|uniref:UPF0434 protein CLV79_101433 n=2 Tax=Paracoccaceae TaxID=31989 RepID=A0A1X6YJZ9_9RHOB|nr:hypothetical protein CLV79_101433 [Limimaricola soesokkakensis]SLN22719.1 hypothetical protein LOS8367_00654 [Limimaricola soesokkakensis]